MDFFIFYHPQVGNFQILNQSEWNQNFAENFLNHRKQKQMLRKYKKTGQNQQIILWKFVRSHEILLSFVKYRKISSSIGKYQKILLN